jgi:hypothetical protein
MLFMICCAKNYDNFTEHAEKFVTDIENVWQNEKFMDDYKYPY